MQCEQAKNGLTLGCGKHRTMGHNCGLKLISTDDRANFLAVRTAK
jgi:hypothetical protein